MFMLVTSNSINSFIRCFQIALKLVVKCDELYFINILIDVMIFAYVLHCA